jgi:hypothetical protein
MGSGGQEAVFSSFDSLETRRAWLLGRVVLTGDRDRPPFGEKDGGEKRVDFVTASDFKLTQGYPIDTLAGRFLYDSDTHGRDARVPM